MAEQPPPQAEGCRLCKSALMAAKAGARALSVASTSKSCAGGESCAECTELGGAGGATLCGDAQVCLLSAICSGCGVSHTAAKCAMDSASKWVHEVMSACLSFSVQTLCHKLASHAETCLAKPSMPITSVQLSCKLRLTPPRHCPAQLRVQENAHSPASPAAG